jgi:type I restriction enzyme M protein
MIDASAGFMKDGPKNRLRAQDIHRIVDVFTSASMCPLRAHGARRRDREERVQPQPAALHRQPADAEDLQDIEGHLQGRHPRRDVTRWQRYWACVPGCAGSSSPTAPATSTWPWRRRRSSHDLRAPRVRRLHCGHERPLRAWWQGKTADARSPEARLPSEGTDRQAGRGPARPLRRQAADRPPTTSISTSWTTGPDDAGRLLPHRRRRLEGRDDRIVEKDKKGKEKDKGWTCDLVPKALIVARYFAKEQAAIDQLRPDLEGVTAPHRAGRGTRRRGRRLRRTRQGEQGQRHRPAQGDRRATKTEAAGRSRRPQACGWS